MRLICGLALLAAATTPAVAFTPASRVAAWGSSTVLQSTVEAVSGAEIKAKYDAALEKMKAKDASSAALSKEDLKIVYEDEHIVVVDKPSGVLSVSGKDGSPSLAGAVFEAYGCEGGSADKMVVHRLGMDTSGLIVFARTMAALRGMNSAFRTRKVTRTYEALVCGHVEQDSGVIDMPLMRDYEFPPFMRVSSDEHQRALIGLDADEVGKKLLESPKESLTKYEVVAREELGGHPVSRVALTSISGRTHQLNVHCAAFGHPIVADSVYGVNGDAAPNGGVDEATIQESNPSRASGELQQQIADAASDKSMCVHAKSISFEHPVTGEKLSFESGASF
mmetsp:Transcript_37038/g.49111  ORF Transcript_37038/g.49111 Transcript_37038/m.49111 type:complete len:336 (-) Transcript_37038:76-1083(-)